MFGIIQQIEVAAPSLEKNPLGDPAIRATPVYLPPGYEEGERRFPVIYFLHGFAGNAAGWLNAAPFSLNVPERLDRLISRGVVPPVIGVFVDGWTALGGSQWLNSEATGRYEDYVARDVVDAIDRRLRTLPSPAARALVGKSSGGYGALSLARRPDRRFAHVASHAADAYFEYCYLPDFPKAATALLKAGGPEAWVRAFRERALETRSRGEDHPVLNTLAMAAAYSPRLGAPLNLELPFDQTTARLREDVWERWLAADPVRFVPRNVEAYAGLKSLFIDCGLKDEFSLRWGTTMIIEALAAAGVSAHSEFFEDGHMGTSYRYERSLSYLVPRMERE